MFALHPKASRRPNPFPIFRERVFGERRDDRLRRSLPETGHPLRKLA